MKPTKLFFVSGAFFLFLAAGTGAPAYAGGEIFATLNTCTTANCGAIVEGTTIKAFNGSAGKWTAEIFAAAGECMRFSVVSQYADTLAVVVAPNGQSFRDDDGGGSLRPLVKIDPTPNNGWYTVSLGRFAGAADTGNVTIAYGRYPHGNPNCSAPTGPLAVARSLSKRAGAVHGPNTDEPGAE